MNISNFLFILAIIIVLVLSLINQNKIIYVIITLILVIAMFFYEQINTTKKIRNLNKKINANTALISSLKRELSERKEKIKKIVKSIKK